MIQHLERSIAKLWQKRAEKIAERRQQDVKDESQDCLMTMGNSVALVKFVLLALKTRSCRTCVPSFSVSDKNKVMDPSTQAEDKLRRFAEREARRCVLRHVATC